MACPVQRWVRNRFYPGSLRWSRKALTVYCCITNHLKYLVVWTTICHDLSKARADWGQLEGSSPYLVSAGSHGHPEVWLDWSIQDGSLVGLVLGAGCQLEAQLGLSPGASVLFPCFHSILYTAYRFLKVQSWKWHSFMYAAFSWLKQVTWPAHI